MSAQGIPRRRAAAILAALALLCACRQEAGAPEPAGVPARSSGVRVTEVALGDAVGLDKKVLRPAEVFDPEDTIHVSVVTEGTSSNTLLGARWLRNGRVLEETTQAIAPAGWATSEFHVFKPGGFAPGEYEVEVLVEGRAVHKRRFSVRAGAGGD